MNPSLSPSLDALPPRDPQGAWRAIIEAARGSRSKTRYRAEWRAMALFHVLPLGMVFPYDFGFVPSTRGDDGDPLDVLVLAAGTHG
jgi:inorganic pyrophosphatase